MLSGTASEVTDDAIRSQVIDQLRVERQDEELWPSVHTNALFELSVETCLLMRTLQSADLPAGPTTWHRGP